MAHSVSAFQVVQGTQIVLVMTSTNVLLIFHLIPMVHALLVLPVSTLLVDTSVNALLEQLVMLTKLDARVQLCVHQTDSVLEMLLVMPVEELVLIHVPHHGVVQMLTVLQKIIKQNVDVDLDFLETPMTLKKDVFHHALEFGVVLMLTVL